MADVRPAVLSAAAVLLLSAAGWTAYSTDLLRTHPGRTATPGIATGTAVVVRADVRQQAPVTGTIGYAGSYSVIAPAGPAAASGGGGTTGLITWLPAVGATVSRGRTAYAVNGQPVPLFYGSRPAWRDMAPGVTPGPDVRQLQRNLAALGFGSGAAADGRFGPATELAVERWQQAAGLPVTGTVPLGQVVFLPGPLLVGQQVAAVGGPLPAGTPIVAGTGTTPDVQVALDPNAALTVHPGDRVIVTLPDGSTDPGVITQVSAVAETPPASSHGGGGQQQPAIPVTARLLRPDRGVLAVPITALLAEPGGRFAVVVTGGRAGHVVRRTVPVRTGLFDEVAGVVEVSGPGLAAGQHVAVPAP
jgi:peptidoglycan hydrolase-like protein with peptidoglycan-binding domain